MHSRINCKLRYKLCENFNLTVLCKTLLNILKNPLCINIKNKMTDLYYDEYGFWHGFGMVLSTVLTQHLE